MNRFGSFLLIALFVATSLMIGCGNAINQISQSQDSPQDVFIAALKAANNGNYPEAEKYLSSMPTVNNNDKRFPRGKSDAWDNTTRKRTVRGVGLINDPEYCEDLSNWEDLPEGSTVTVMVSIYYKNSSCEPMAMTEMIKENGMWKIKEWNHRPHGDFLSYPCPRKCGEGQEVYTSIE